MKKVILFVLIALAFSCSSSEDSTQTPPTSDIDNSGLPMTPTAVIQYNDSNFGIYKGIVVGSAGTIVINLMNDDATSATMVVDGVTHTFTTADIITLDQPINAMIFTSGNNSFKFSVDGNGLNPNMSNLILENHPDASGEVIKEYSDALVRCYVGTFSGDDEGDLTLMRIENSVYGLTKSNTEEDSHFIEGTIDTNLVINGVLTVGTFKGYVNGATLSGTWKESSSVNGTWTSQRVL